MIVINTVNDEIFTYNGIEYYKNFTPVVPSNSQKVRILNTYDSSIELTSYPTIYSEFNVNGIVYTNISDLQEALLPVVYTRNSLGSTNTNITIVSALPTSNIDTSLIYKMPDDSLQFYNGTDWVIVGGVTAQNGLNTDDDEDIVELGGSLTKNTIISTNGVSFSLTGGENQGLISTSNQPAYAGGFGSIEIGISDAFGFLKSGFKFFRDKMLFISNYGKGIEYGADYSATYSNRSLVDKEWVDDNFASKSTPLKAQINNGYEFFTDFNQYFSNNNVINGELFISATGGGGNMSQGVLPGTNYDDVLVMTMQTTATSRPYLNAGSSLYTGGYEMATLIIPTDLPSLTEKFRLMIGLGSTPADSDQVNGIYFLYDKYGEGNVGTASDNYLCVCKNGASISVVDSGIPYQSLVGRKLSFVKNTLGTEVEFYIDNLLVATITTNIPTASMRQMINGEKYLGTGTITVNFDYLYYKSYKNRI